MELIIVDDDIISADAIKVSVSWEQLGIEQVHTAYSYAEAVDVMTKNDVRIVISDIEMPQKNGFDLLEWIRKNRQNVVTIMLTSYAVFDYAKQALEYQCTDYLLKPVSDTDLVNSVKKAISILDRMNTDQKNRKLAEYWNGNEESRVIELVREILNRGADLPEEEIVTLATELHTELAQDSLYLPIMFCQHNSSGIWNNELKQAIRDEVLFNSGRAVSFIYNGNYISILAGSIGLENIKANLSETIKTFLAEHRISRETGISAYIGEFQGLNKLYAQYQVLVHLRLNNVADRLDLFDIAGMDPGKEYITVDFTEWEKAFNQGNYKECMDVLSGSIGMLTHGNKLNYDTLNRLYQDFMQMFYIEANAKGIRAYLLVEQEEAKHLHDTATKSVNGFLQWANYLTESAGSMISLVSDQQILIAKACRYIEENLQEDLGRKEIADKFCMSPDYFSKVFHQETGMKLIDYINTVRMKAALHKLITTDEPVGSIAIETGYKSSTYFDRVFKINYGVTPVQYRAGLDKSKEKPQ